ncbi:unnamed protein product, partial [marine sediment metagenome]
DDLEKNLQLTLYQLAAEQTWHLPVERLTLYHLRSNTPCSCAARDEARLEEARHLVLEVAQNITDGKFLATENQYCPCDFAEYCPYYRQKVTPLEEVDILRGMAVDEAVEHYVSLQSQIKELESQLDEIKQMIISFCQAEGLNRVYGREHAITYRLMDKTGFSEDEVRGLLEPEGLWQRVLSLDQSRLKQLITDEAIAKDVGPECTRVWTVEYHSFSSVSYRQLVEMTKDGIAGAVVQGNHFFRLNGSSARVNPHVTG